MYTNYSNISLPLAVWLAADNTYDLVHSPNVISATTLLNPIRSIILSRRITKDQAEIQDIASIIPSCLGSAVHTAVEVAWKDHYKAAMKNLGYPDKVIDKVKINPKTPSNNVEFDIYLEQRTARQIGKWTVSGKYDLVMGGRLRDTKTTKTYNWIKGTNDTKYAQQGSIYRWLNTDVILHDYIDVEMVFTDWNPMKALANKSYPRSQILTRTLPLMSIEDTEKFVLDKLSLIETYDDVDQIELSKCTPEELWMDPPKWAYYKDPSKTNKATKLFTNEMEAINRKVSDGNVGMIVKREMEPTYCKYCKGSSICTQAAEYVAQGILKL